MTARRSSFFDENWNLDLESRGDQIELTLLLVGLGAPAVVKVALPASCAQAVLRVLADVLYADAELMVAAVRIHQQQHGGGEPKIGPGIPLVLPTKNTAHTGNTTRSRSSPCARRRRR